MTDVDPEVCQSLQNKYFKPDDLQAIIAKADRASRAVGHIARWASSQVQIGANRAAEAREEIAVGGGDSASADGRTGSNAKTEGSKKGNVPLVTPPGVRKKGTTPPPSRSPSSIGGKGPHKRAAAPLLGFTTLAAAQKQVMDEQAKKKAEHERELANRREPLPDAAFTLLRNKFKQTNTRIEELEGEEGSSRQVRIQAKEELDKLEKEAESVLKVLEELDINPDAWDDKLWRVKKQLMSMLGESESRRAVFQWWENMAHTHVTHMGQQVSKGLHKGEFGVKVALGKGLSSIDAGVCVGKAGELTVPKWERQQIR